jgi:small subunit ribosomal protein S3
MGQKVHPYILRIGFGKDWHSKWFSNRTREYADFLEEDMKIRSEIKNSYPAGSVASVIIERVSNGAVKIFIRTSRPGVIIGRRGQEITRLKKTLQEMTKKELDISPLEVHEPSLEAQLVAEQIGFQLIRRVNFRRAMKKAIQQVTSLGGEGIKLRCSGRLGGVEIARKESYKYGKVPLQTFRADIDYGYYIARTTYGTIGVKVWIYKGEKRLGSYMIRDEQTQRT